jgi:uroporphyrinogen decarboxylase
MLRKPLREKARRAYEENRRLVVPLVGFPGLNTTQSTIKLAQQNYGEHLRVVKSLAEMFKPDIIFPLMDLSVEANALGRHTVFPKEDSATVVRDHFDMDELERIQQINIAFDTRLLGYVETVKLMSMSLPEQVLRGAYVTGPYTLAALLMGADEAAMATVLRPEELTAVCQVTTEKIQEYVRLLIAAGAQVICILEPSAVMLGPDQFEQFSAQYVHHINNSCKYTGVGTVYHTCGNTMHLIEKMAGAGVDGLSLDSAAVGVDLAQAAQRVPAEVAVIGNVNPTGAILRGQPGQVREEVRELLNRMEPYPNFVLATGCDLPQETPLENIAAFMDAGREYRRASKAGKASNGRVQAKIS